MKTVQRAFAIALVILSGICTVRPEAELMSSIVYAVVIPSFILSLISFVTEISEHCEKEAENLSSLEKKAEVITTFPIKIKANENFFRAFTVYR